MSQTRKRIKSEEKEEKEELKEKIIKLKYSIPIPKEGGGFVNTNEIKIGRLKAKHLRLLPEDFAEKDGVLSPSAIIPLVAGLADIPESSADEIDMEDMTEVAEALQSFLGESLETGKK